MTEHRGLTLIERLNGITGALILVMFGAAGLAMFVVLRVRAADVQLLDQRIAVAVSAAQAAERAAKRADTETEAVSKQARRNRAYFASLHAQTRDLIIRLQTKQQANVKAIRTVERRVGLPRK